MTAELRRIGPATPTPNAEIIRLLRGLLASAESGELQDIAAVWSVGLGILENAITTDPLAIGAIAYTLAHRLMHGDPE